MIGIHAHRRLSPLDASFLEVESPTAHMHVGWVGLFRPPQDRERPTFPRIREYVRGRLGRAPRYRQKLAFVPLGVHDPVWIDDVEFDIRNHVKHSNAHSIDDLIEGVFSTPLRRDRPLWELWIADRLQDGCIGVVGKVHHCMVDGIAAVELVSLFLDPSPDADPGAADEWRPTPGPRRAWLLAEAVHDRIGEELDLLRIPAGVVRSPRRLFGMADETRKAAGSLAHSLAPPAPPSVFNEPISASRALGRVRRPVSDLLRVKERYGATLNDVVLAVSAGAVRRFLQQHGEVPIRLKAMVPVSVRGDGDVSELGNRVSFLFIELPCDEPDPVRRLADVHAVMSERKRADEPGGGQTILQAFGYVPHPLQHAVTHAVASARAFNLVVSNVPGPRTPLYLLGCPMEEVYPVVPLADGHSVAIGFTTLADGAYFGVYVDPGAVPDPGLLASDIDEAIDELLAGAPQPAGTASETGSRTA